MVIAMQCSAVQYYNEECHTFKTVQTVKHCVEQLSTLNSNDKTSSLEYKSHLKKSRVGWLISLPHGLFEPIALGPWHRRHFPSSIFFFFAIESWYSKTRLSKFNGQLNKENKVLFCLPIFSVPCNIVLSNNGRFRIH